MARTTDTAAQLERLVQKLQEERQHHMEQIDEIDRTLSRLGIEPGKATKRRTKKTKTAKKRGAPKGRGRRRYGKTAEQFILDLLKSGKEMTTADINAAWRKAGRPGDAATTLTKLSKDGKIKRENIKGARGSKYKLS